MSVTTTVEKNDGETSSGRTVKDFLDWDVSVEAKFLFHPAQEERQIHVVDVVSFVPKSPKEYA